MLCKLVGIEQEFGPYWSAKEVFICFNANSHARDDERSLESLRLNVGDIEDHIRVSRVAGTVHGYWSSAENNAVQVVHPSVDNTVEDESEQVKAGQSREFRERCDAERARLKTFSRAKVPGGQLRLDISPTAFIKLV